jgi:hypothetical protein
MSSPEIQFAETAPYDIDYAGFESERIPFLTVDAYQAATNVQANYHDKTENAAEYTAYGMLEEGGELSWGKLNYIAVLVAHHESLAEGDIPDDVRMGMMYEAGDMLWYLAQRAENEGYSLSEIAQQQCAERLLVPEKPDELTLDTYQQLARLMPELGALQNKWGLEVTAQDNLQYVLTRRMNELVWASTGLDPTAPTTSMLKRYEPAEAIGNAFWAVAQVADRIGVPLSQVAAYNLAKLNSRSERGVGFGEGRGDYR